MKREESITLQKSDIRSSLFIGLDANEKEEASSSAFVVDVDVTEKEKKDVSFFFVNKRRTLSFSSSTAKNFIAPYGLPTTLLSSR